MWSDFRVGRGKWKDLTQLTQLHVPKNLENAPALVLTQLRHCHLPHFLKKYPSIRHL